LAALKNLNDFLSKHTDIDPVLARSFYENAMACEGNAISGKESQKHLDSMRFEHPPAILASWEAVPGFVDSGIKVLHPSQDYLDYQRTEKAKNDQSAVTSFAELGPTVDLSAADNKQTKYDLTAKMAPGIGNRYARALVYTGQQCVFNDDDYRATNQGQAIKVKSFGDGQGYSPSHHDGVFGQYRDGDIGERNNVVEEADGTKVGFGGCLKGLLAFNLLSCRGIGVFARQRTQEVTGHQKHQHKTELCLLL
jgi:hypothetical protein